MASGVLSAISFSYKILISGMGLPPKKSNESIPLSIPALLLLNVYYLRNKVMEYAGAFGKILLAFLCQMISEQLNSPGWKERKPCKVR